MHTRSAHHMANLIENKRIGFDYEIIERYDAGIELLGTEVKTIRARRGSLVGAFITIRGGEVFLMNSDIPPYQEKNAPADYDPLRQRRLLLNKSEIAKLGSIEAQKGLTIVPISMYNKERKIKVEIGVVRGKKQYDKRETLKKRDAKREIERTLKTR